jgi:hypothetical protein
MKRLLTILSVVIFFVLLFSCGKDFNLVDCSSCLDDEPKEEYLLIKITISEENDSIPLIWYRGRIEDNVVEWVDTATYAQHGDGDIELWTKVNQYYSVKAFYKTKDGRTIVAVDGDKFVAKDVTDACDSQCWILKGDVLDVRLKYP